MTNRPERHRSQPTHYDIARTSLHVAGKAFSLHLPLNRVPPLPAVLVLHSAMGRTSSVLQWCDRLAERGFAAVAFDFFDGQLAESPEAGLDLRDAANTRSNELQEIIERTYAQLQTDPRVLATDRFLLGWSFGGAWATFLAGVLPDVTGVVAYYGQAFTDDPSLYQRLTAPILLVGATTDLAPAPSRLRSIVQRLRSEDRTADLLIVSAGHGFAERNHPGYDRKAAEGAWTRTMDFLESHRAP